MKKMSKQQYDSLTHEQQKIIDELGVVVENCIVPRRRSADADQSNLENYACIVETTCKLCNTTSTKIFLMEGVGGLLTSNECTMQDVEGLTVKTRNESTLTCAHCHEVLKAMCQEDLIALVLRIAKGEKPTRGR